MEGRIEHKDTFSTRELSQIPKFVQKKMADKAELNRIKKKLAWRKEDIPPSVDEPLSTFEKENYNYLFFMSTYIDCYN